MLPVATWSPPEVVIMSGGDGCGGVGGGDGCNLLQCFYPLKEGVAVLSVVCIYRPPQVVNLTEVEVLYCVGCGSDSDGCVSGHCDDSGCDCGSGQKNNATRQNKTRQDKSLSTL